MLAQRRRRRANISPALGQGLVFDRLYDTKRWREMNQKQMNQKQTPSTEDSQHRPRPSKHKALNQCCFDAGSKSQTVDQLESASRVTPSKHVSFIQYCFNVGPSSSTLARPLKPYCVIVSCLLGLLCG